MFIFLISLCNNQTKMMKKKIENILKSFIFAGDFYQSVSINKRITNFCIFEMSVT